MWDGSREPRGVQGGAVGAAGALSTTIPAVSLRQRVASETGWRVTGRVLGVAPGVCGL